MGSNRTLREGALPACLIIAPEDISIPFIFLAGNLKSFFLSFRLYMESWALCFVILSSKYQTFSTPVTFTSPWVTDIGTRPCLQTLALVFTQVPITTLAPIDYCFTKTYEMTSDLPDCSVREHYNTYSKQSFIHP